MPDRKMDIVGQKFGRLTALEPAPKKKWLCRCECGRTVLVVRASLLKGGTRSCGCLRREVAARGMGPRMRRHGLSHLPECGIWRGMLDRCYNPRSRYFANYGGRGIEVCDRWRNDVAAFITDMGPRPSDAHSIDRIDNDGNYCPDNCRWATRIDQANNSRWNHVVTFRGETKTLAQWGRELALDPDVISERLVRGWSIERALTSKKGSRRQDARLLSLRGETKTITEWARATGIGRTTIGMRLDQGWTPERALTTPPDARRRRKKPRPPRELP